MKCQKCKLENAEGSKFCINCGAPLTEQQVEKKHEIKKDIHTSTDTKDPGDHKDKKKRERTFGEKFFVYFTHTALFLSALFFIFILLAKVSYKETVNQRDRDGEIDVVVSISPTIGWGRTAAWAYDVAPSEIDSKAAALRPIAISKYQNMINDGLLYSFIILVIVLIIDRYVTKICTPK